MERWGPKARRSITASAPLAMLFKGVGFGSDKALEDDWRDARSKKHIYLLGRIVDVMSTAGIAGLTRQEAW